MTREELNDGIQKEIIKEHKKEIIKKGIKITVKILLVGTILAFLFFTYTTYISTSLIKVQEYRIINEKIPSSFKGLKIIHFSDLHLGSSFDIEDMKKVRKLSNERKPDLVLFTGDLIYKKNLEKEKQEDLIKELKKMKASIGKYAILGDEDNEKISTIFNQSDFTILRNEYDLIYKEKENPILLVGISSMLKNQQDLKKAYSYFELPTHNSNIYTISMFHEPDLTNDIMNNPSDLLLSGHSHNGQIRIPFLNKGILIEKGAKTYNNPHYSIDNKELYISSGLGTKTGFRLFCRPSINFYRLSNS
ncbi:MAG: metallophosphoesterase [Bacilli bacterium]|nr:metallophosphoesterase [Bacilli bacterium]